MKQFTIVGDKIQYISDHKARNNSWPEGAWLENGIVGSVSEYHPELSAMTIKGELFESIPPYAVVQFDNGATTCIDPDEVNKRWRFANAR